MWLWQCLLHSLGLVDKSHVQELAILAGEPSRLRGLTMVFGRVMAVFGLPGVMAPCAGLPRFGLADLAIEVADEGKEEVHGNDKAVSGEGDVREEDQTEPPARRYVSGASMNGARVTTYSSGRWVVWRTT